MKITIEGPKTVERLGNQPPGQYFIYEGGVFQMIYVACGECHCLDLQTGRLARFGCDSMMQLAYLTDATFTLTKD